MGGDDFSQRTSRTKGREATEGVIPGRFALSVGKPDLPAPPGWRWTPLSDVAQLESGHTPSRKHPEYWNEGIPWIGIRDAVDNHGRQIHDTYQHVSQLGLENSSARLLPPRTVCLSRTASVGYVVVMGTTMATSQDFVNWVCGPGLEPEYLKYVLLAENDSLLRFASGTTHQTIYYPEAKAFHALLPPLDEQRAVVRVLGTLDDKIELNRKMTGTLEAMARALFKSWFVDFDPVRAKAAGRAPSGMDAGTAELFPSELVESESKSLPKEWRYGSIGEFVELQRGTTYKSALKDLPGPVLLGLGSIQRNGGFRDDKLSTYGGDSPERLLVYPGEIFASLKDVTQSADLLGAVARVPRHVADGRLTQDTVKLQLTGTIDIGEVLYRTLLTDEYREYCRQHATGTTNLGLSRDDLLSYPIVVAAAPVLDAFNRSIRSLSSRAEFAVMESRTLVRIRDELLPRLLSGELSVAHAEREAEAVA